MALRLSISSSHGPASSPAISTCRPAACGRFPALVGGSVASQKRSLTVMTGSEMRGVTAVRSSSLETTSVGAEAVTGQVTEVNKDTFWPIVKAAGDKVVVLDMYTQWCGPCKVMAPKFQEMSEKNLDVVFLKLDCNQDNKVSWVTLLSCVFTVLLCRIYGYAMLKNIGAYYILLAASCKRAGHKGCANIQDSQGRKGCEGSHWCQDR
ncbi:unnamed protein product [Urochloa decumbens]|uniref:Thioredoxin domain-containing protein n=1 Tax=Urochloa decumbens TaxID=240449 RepID=A0ABC8XIH6_9POAL